jgi:outer membrane protein TolC
MKPYAAALCALLLSGSALAAPAALVATPGADVASLLDWARAHNPEFAAMRYDAEAAAERVQPAGALPDPVLRTELQDITNNGRSAAPNLLPGRIGSTKYTLLQPIPFWGKRDLKRAAAEAGADESTARSQALWADLAARIKAAYAQYYYVVRSQQLTDEVAGLTKQLEQLAQGRYANGLSAQQDAVRAQVEMTALRGEQLAIETERHHLQSKINTLLSRPAMAPLAEPRQLRPTPNPAQLDAAALEERLRSRSPLLLAESARLRAAEKNRDLTQRNRYPDFTFGVAPIQMANRVDQWEVMVEFNLPLQQETRRSQEREAEALVNAAQARQQSATEAAVGELNEDLAAVHNAHRLETLTASSLLPQAELTFQSALSAYQNGKVDFATLLDAQRLIRKAKQDLLKARSEGQLRLADIERLLGEDL